MYIQNMEFEWDAEKNKANQKKHRISFEEAAEIFCYPMYEVVDTRLNYRQVRFIGIGRNNQRVILTVVYTEQEASIRIISARRANKKEKQLYYTVRKHIDEIPPMSEERAKELEAMSNEDIDYSDIPSLDEEFFKNAKLVKRKPRTEQISIRVDTEVLEWFKTHAQEKGYQTLINDVLRTYIKHNS